MTRPRVAITGATGQLGRALLEAFRADWETVALARPAADVRDPAIARLIEELKPTLVVNAAAMTHVDGCALDPDAAFVANALGARNVAIGCQRAGSAMIQISTNEVFDGSQSMAYTEFDTPRPINAYGASKLAGEQQVRDLLDRFFIVRTAWLFGHGGNNFIEKILKVVEAGSPLRVVDDEIGSPTYCNDLAEAVKSLATGDLYGTYHVANEGACSRFEFASRVLAISDFQLVIEPISSREFSRPSQPPPFSALRSLSAGQAGIHMRSWDAAVRAYLTRRKQGIG